MIRTKSQHPGWNRSKYYLRNVGPFDVGSFNNDAALVVTRDQDVYVNLQNGYFVRQDSPHQEVPGTQLYVMAKEVYDGRQRLMAVARRPRADTDGVDRAPMAMKLRRVMLEAKKRQGVGRVQENR